MEKQSGMLLPSLQATVNNVLRQTIETDRIAVLNPMIAYIQQKVDEGQTAHLNFICTHNSRRSQLSQIWAQTAAYYYGIPAKCYSGGVEVTAFNERAVASIIRSGFRVENTTPNSANPVYHVYYSEEAPPLVAFSKLFDDPINKADQFAAVMTCSHADENCPFIPGTEKRIPVRYEDPKEFDGTALEAEKYDERSMQIASEMFYVFLKVKY